MIPALGTDGADRSRAGRAVEFHRGALGGNVERVIFGVASADREPLVAISHWRGQARAGQILIFRPCVQIVRAAIASARSGEGCGRFDAGEFPSRPGGVAIRCWARARPPSPGVVVFHRMRPDRTRIGRATTLRGDELDALSRALDWLSTTVT